MQIITRKGSFDSMHRVMHERFKCYNVHGHTYLYELHFGFEDQQDIGYAVDFKEIKRIACQWIDDMFDHGAILNPHDEAMIAACSVLDSKLWVMSLNGKGYCNPTVENIARELFLGVRHLMKGQGVVLKEIVLYETPNCFTRLTALGLSARETDNFFAANLDRLDHYKASKGVEQYDIRKVEPGHE